MIPSYNNTGRSKPSLSTSCLIVILGMCQPFPGVCCGLWWMMSSAGGEGNKDIRLAAWGRVFPCLSPLLCSQHLCRSSGFSGYPWKGLSLPQHQVNTSRTGEQIVEMLGVSFVAQRCAAADTELFRVQSQKLLADGWQSFQPGMEMLIQWRQWHCTNL